MSKFKPGDVVAVKGRILGETFVGVGGDDGEEEVVYRRWADIAPWISPGRIAALERVADSVPDLIDWMERYRGGDRTLHAEEFYIRRDEARIALAALADPPGSRDPQ